MTAQILNACPDAETIVCDEPAEHLSRDPVIAFVQAKRSLFLAEHKGPLVRPLSRPYGQGKPEWYLYSETGCPFDCQYCFLQDWLSCPVPTIHVNRGDFLDQIEQAYRQSAESMYLHAGEMADALAWDHLTRQSDALAKACRRFPGLTVELRTKSVNVDGLIERNEPSSNLMVSWTMAPKTAILKYEPRTASLEDRLPAMRRTANAGFPVAVRLDPVVIEGDFESDYTKLIEKIDEALGGPPAQINAGSLRMTESCLALAKRRFPKSMLFAGELIQTADKKRRYSRPLRKRAFRAIAEATQRLWNMPVFFCMEPD